MALLLTQALFDDFFLLLYHSSISCIRQQSRERRGGVGLSGVGFWSVPIESVGASGVWGGWEGLYGRPPSLAATFTHPVINQTGLRGRP